MPRGFFVRWHIISRMAKKNQTITRTFEDGMRELETILTDIERGEMGVEESIVRYDRGAFLIQHCRGVLNTAQVQIEALAKPPAEGAGGEDPAAEEENVDVPLGES